MGLLNANRSRRRSKKARYDYSWEENNKCQIIDFAVPFDTRVDEKEKEKIFKYQDLARELKIL